MDGLVGWVGSNNQPITLLGGGTQLRYVDVDVLHGMGLDWKTYPNVAEKFISVIVFPLSVSLLERQRMQTDSASTGKLSFSCGAVGRQIVCKGFKSIDVV